MSAQPQPPKPRRGLDVLAYLERLWRHIVENTVFPGYGLILTKGSTGFQLSLAANVTIDYAGVLYGPWDATDGKFVVVDVNADTVTQKSVGTIRPTHTPKHEVWIDLSATYGRVYIPRLG